MFFLIFAQITVSFSTYILHFFVAFATLFSFYGVIINVRVIKIAPTNPTTRRISS